MELWRSKALAQCKALQATLCGWGAARRPSKKDCSGDFPGGAAVENLPSNVEDEGPIPS